MTTSIEPSRWTVIVSAPGRDGRALCRCVCGKERMVRDRNLRDGRSRSCGCLRREVVSVTRAKHRMIHTPEYQAWKRIRGRCGDINDKSYPNYGGRGIQICERWDSFENFFDDMGPRPSPVHSIDRIDNNGNYDPSNCRWATQTVQQNNKRSNRLFTRDGRTQTITEWCREFGIAPQIVWCRLRRGWDTSDALTLPLGAKRVTVTLISTKD